MFCDYKYTSKLFVNPIIYIKFRRMLDYLILGDISLNYLKITLLVFKIWEYNKEIESGYPVR